MASGAILLARLKARQIRPGGSEEPAPHPPAPPPPARHSAIPPPPTQLQLRPLELEPRIAGDRARSSAAAEIGGCEPGSSGRATKPDVNGGSRSHARIVICNGVDCGGLGAGAALLEIEELVAEHSTLTSTATVVFGACTLQCANAPVVNVLHNGVSHALDVTAEHLSCVNSASRAEAVVAAALRREPNAAEASISAMQRRADGMRFEALKRVARARPVWAKPHGSVGETAWTKPRDCVHESHRLLRTALQAEASAVRGYPKRAARAERRVERFRSTCGLDAVQS